MVPEQDRKIGDSETKKGRDGACREKKDAGKGPDQGCLVHVSYDNISSYTYTQSHFDELEVFMHEMKHADSGVFWWLFATARRRDI